MAITIGNVRNSGNVTGSNVVGVVNHTSAPNIHSLVAIITGYDSGATDYLITSFYVANGMSQTNFHLASSYRNGSAFLYIYYLNINELQAPEYSGNGFNVYFTGTLTDVQMTVLDICGDSGEAGLIYDNAISSNSTTTSHNLLINPSHINSLMVGGIVDIQSAITNLSVTSGYGTEITGSEVDMGSQVVGCAYRITTGTTNEIRWTKSAAATSMALGATFYAQKPPTVTLDIANNTTFNTSTPGLNFTGLDELNNTIDYHIQIDRNSTFDSSIPSISFDNNLPETSQIVTGMTFMHFQTQDENYYYAANQQSGTIIKIVRISKLNLANQVVETLDSSCIYCWGLQQDNLYLYVLCYGTGIGDSKIVRILKTNFSSIDHLSIPEQNGVGGMQTFAQDANYLYTSRGYINDNNLNRVYRISKSDFSTIVVLYLRGAPYYEGINDMVSDGNYLFGTLGNGSFIKIPVSSFSSPVYGNVPVAPWSGGGIVESGDYIYCLVGNSYGTIKRILKSDLSVTTLDTGYTNLDTLGVDDNYIYAIKEIGSDTMIRVSKSDFSTIATHVMTTGPDLQTPKYLMRDAQYLVFIQTTDINPRIIRVGYPGEALINAYSTDHIGFSAGENHPTNSGIQQTYTPQSALSNGTYYWRVRAIDPTGSNTWGPWSPGDLTLGYNTFIVSTGPSSIVVKVWNGASWDTKILKYWNGSVWTSKTPKVWNGSSWT